MIARSFTFLEGIGKSLESKIFGQDIKNWDDFLNSEKINGLSRHRKSYYDRKIIEARKALYSFDSSFFMGKLPNCENWRIYDFFREDAVFLDIETTGLGRYDDVTVVGLYDGLNTKSMIKGINLDFKALKNELANYKVVVTFNGSSFDAPFLERIYPGLIPKVPHFDVKVLARRLGYVGGLKKIEKLLGLKRPELVENFYGGDALTLWKMYRATQDDYYLKLLVEYNEYDIINLKSVAEKLISKIKE
ncbi:MAG TPA: ribonuclease H-like domain-containing protein [Candidatus Nanoarchaeia archaeon]|nr:ribonuclease H-like domain-containing protein [Candidatus Nanoarchaeia archaeon]